MSEQPTGLVARALPAGHRTEEEIAIDQHVGRRLRQARIALGLTQADLAALAGITYQQVHKYETGYNRLSASKIFVIGRALNLPPGYFFEHLESVPEVDTSTPQEARLFDETRRRETLELARLYSMFEGPMRDAFLSLLRRMAALLPAEEMT